MEMLEFVSCGYFVSSVDKDSFEAAFLLVPKTYRLSWYEERGDWKELFLETTEQLSERELSVLYDLVNKNSSRGAKGSTISIYSREDLESFLQPEGKSNK